MYGKRPLDAWNVIEEAAQDKRLGIWSGGVDKATRRPREHPLVFSLSGQTAIIDNEWKILEDPSAGHCVLAIVSLVLPPHDWDPQLRWDPRK